VPAAAVIPAHLVFFIIVVVKKFLAMVKLVIQGLWVKVECIVDFYIIPLHFFCMIYCMSGN